MSGEDLAQFLIAPTPPNGGYAFQPQQQQQQPAVPNAGGQLPADFGLFDREVPYIHGPQVPHWKRGDDDDDDSKVTEAESIEKMLEVFDEDGGATEDAVEEREDTPRIMKSQLHEYQKIGLTWLINKESSGARGGILADEMGLGKTVCLLLQRFAQCYVFINSRNLRGVLRLLSVWMRC
jgi:hypothetical protein